MKDWQKYGACYVHIPFCKQKCLYCDFTSYGGKNSEQMTAYVDMLCREMNERQALQLEKNATIYIGGGTPSILPIREIVRLVQAMKQYRFWQQPAEATLEANPGTVNLEKLRALRELGFDRISFGVQSLQQEELLTLGRIHNPQQALEALHWAQEAGFDRINVDVMYGLPGQTMASYKNTLEQLVVEGLKHISAYSLILEEGTPLEKKVEKGILVLPEEELVGDMYDFTNEYLPGQGLQRYEISNYAMLGQESKHNIQYWQYRPYLALGVAACNFAGEQRFTHTRSLECYLEHWSRDMEVEELSEAVQLEEYLFMGLRQTKGVDLKEAYERFGVKVLESYEAILKNFFDQKMLVYDVAMDRLKLTEKGMALGNRVFEALLTTDN